MSSSERQPLDSPQPAPKRWGRFLVILGALASAAMLFAGAAGVWFYLNTESLSPVPAPTPTLVDPSVVTPPAVTTFTEMPLVRSVLQVSHWLPYLVVAVIVVAALVLSAVLVHSLVSGHVDAVGLDDLEGSLPEDTSPPPPGGLPEEEQESTSYGWYIAIGGGVLAILVVCAFSLWCGCKGSKAPGLGVPNCLGESNQLAIPDDSSPDGGAVEGGEDGAFGGDEDGTVGGGGDGTVGGGGNGTVGGDGAGTDADQVNSDPLQDQNPNQPLGNVEVPQNVPKVPKAALAKMQAFETSLKDLLSQYSNYVVTEKPEDTRPATHNFRYYVKKDGKFSPESLPLYSGTCTVFEACRLLKRKLSETTDQQLILMPYNISTGKACTAKHPQEYVAITMETFNGYSEQSKIKWLKRVVEGENLAESTIQEIPWYSKPLPAFPSLPNIFNFDQH